MRQLFLSLTFLFLTISLISCSIQEVSQQQSFEAYTKQVDSSKKTSLVSNSQSSIVKDNENTEETNRKENYNVKLVDYDGPVEHIFFHPVIAYPELAFDQDELSKGYNDYFVTAEEFKRTLNELYKNNYILIDIHLLIKNKDNHITKGKLKLPEGKKPLILSIDDMNYYDYMIENGNVYKLIIDDNDNIASYSKNSDGKEVVSYDNAIVPILDQFVKEHPDFSFRGAKGLIALTGYQGILGYRTNEINNDEFTNEKDEVLKVIKLLKETGWTFASHGYGHLDTNKINYERLKKDTNRWKQEVEPFIGSTNVYVYPYGSRAETGRRKFKYLVESGFQILCSIGPKPYLKEYNSNAIMMDRRHIDGIALQTQKEQLSQLLDADKVLESEVRSKSE